MEFDAWIDSCPNAILRDIAGLRLNNHKPFNFPSSSLKAPLALPSTWPRWAKALDSITPLLKSPMNAALSTVRAFFKLASAISRYCSNA
eukprot:CCRYP_015919-RA/>CCRYP_015919-RA protein AED:0.39 eAED:0.39 QI:25/1/1/1/0/0/2/325/88